MSDVISHKRFQDEEAAYQWVEAHLWPHGPECPRCKGRERITKLQGKTTRIGTYKCKDCRKPFTVKIGTIFEDSHVPMRFWLQAIALLTSSKKGISSNQLHRMLGVTLKTAWFMSHRIREAMREGGLAPMGGAGEVVEIDETYHGPKEGAVKGRGGSGHKRVILTLVNRQGEARSFHVEKSNTANVLPIVRENLSNEAVAITDESAIYLRLGEHAARHLTVNHARGEYVSKDRDAWMQGDIHTNTVEGYFALFKRGMRGTYQHCAEKHLHRYLAEFDFRYNARVALGVDDEKRAAKLLRGVKGKRLTYRPAD